MHILLQRLEKNIDLLERNSVIILVYNVHGILTLCRKRGGHVRRKVCRHSPATCYRTLRQSVGDVDFVDHNIGTYRTSITSTSGELYVLLKY